MTNSDAVLVVGEIVVDFTLPQDGAECKLRLGGIVHAARGLWAAELEYSVAAFCPQYLAEDAHHYLAAHGCKEFLWLGDVVGAPNVIVIGEPTELSKQGYEDLLRESKQIRLREPFPNLESYQRVVVFPGKFDINLLLGKFSPTAKFTFDVAYDVKDLSSLCAFQGRTQAIIISTSSELFLAVGNENIDELITEVGKVSPDIFLLKENRGGSRLFNLLDGSVEEIPASLGKTVNSVGVGDVYSAVMVGCSSRGWAEAAWRGCQAATVYSQTTYPDDVKRDVQRSFNLPLEVLRTLGGTMLPWHDRQQFSIYLAGPDFSYVEKPELDRAVDSLTYHNFKVRRPIQENGELTRPASKSDINRTYRLDYRLLVECDAVFAVPLGRDPGTLVEIGIAIALGKPVVTFDPRRENDNTMVVGGSVVYSSSLDECLKGTFNSLAKLRAEST
ncbi:Nucleoside 2-deoxyribosyltransferase [Collimonas sp. OK307]|uniref:nucleoside 2-deoxyribosyltransferase n=1 Tax=Collimonas sp. OK307 TaxID=1801620 RepID=UPI0008E990F5|nr:nucleoside 2-deoxyribosyltransferase [Collimonas sp. OK307]SFI03022.1 Nucleoside 2-deoxyribosyltransferase [Collimonas sp. OK307]